VDWFSRVQTCFRASTLYLRNICVLFACMRLIRPCGNYFKNCAYISHAWNDKWMSVRVTFILLFSLSLWFPFSSPSPAFRNPGNCWTFKPWKLLTLFDPGCYWIPKFQLNPVEHSTRHDFLMFMFTPSMTAETLISLFFGPKFPGILFISCSLWKYLHLSAFFTQFTLVPVILWVVLSWKKSK